MLSEISGTPFSGWSEGYPQEHQVCPLFRNFDPSLPGPEQTMNCIGGKCILSTHPSISKCMQDICMSSMQQWSAGKTASRHFRNVTRVCQEKEMVGKENCISEIWSDFVLAYPVCTSDNPSMEFSFAKLLRKTAIKRNFYACRLYIFRWQDWNSFTEYNNQSFAAQLLIE